MAAAAAAAAAGSVEETSNLTVAVIGPCQSGKSTLCGWLVKFFGDIPARDIARLQTTFEEFGRGRKFCASWLMDRKKIEREAGRTVDGNIAVLHVPPRRQVTLMDTPGHVQHTAKMVSMLCQADAVFLVVSIENWHEHRRRVEMLACYAFMFKVRQVVVVLSKFDAHRRDSANGEEWPEALFEERKAEMTAMLRSIGFRWLGMPLAAGAAPVTRTTANSRVWFVPISEYYGINIPCTQYETNLVDSLTQRVKLQLAAPRMPWYAPDQPSLAGVLPLLDVQPRRTDGPAIVMFSNAYKIGGVGTVLAGGVLSGTLRVADELLLVPGMFATTVRSLEIYHEPVALARAGQQVGINVTDLSVRALKRGYRGFMVARARRTASSAADPQFQTYLSRSEFGTKHLTRKILADFNLPRFCTAFIADIVLRRDKLNKSEMAFQAGAALRLDHCLTSSRVRIGLILAKLDGQFSVIERYPQRVVRGDKLRVELHSSTPLALEEADRIPLLSRFVLSDTRGIVAAGVVRMQTERRRVVRVLLDDEQLRAVVPPSNADLDVVVKLTSDARADWDTCDVLVLSRDHARVHVEHFNERGGTIIIPNAQHATNCAELLCSVQVAELVNAPMGRGQVMPFSQARCVRIQFPNAHAAEQEVALAASADAIAASAAAAAAPTKAATARAASGASASGGTLKRTHAQKIGSRRIVLRRVHRYVAKARAATATAAAAIAATAAAATPAARASGIQSIRFVQPPAVSERAPCQADELLPVELWLHVMHFLDARSLCHLACVSRLLDALSCDFTLWRELCLAHGVFLPPRSDVESFMPELLVKSEWKWRWLVQHAARLGQFGGGVLDGKYGRVREMPAARVRLRPPSSATVRRQIDMIGTFSAKRGGGFAGVIARRSPSGQGTVIVGTGGLPPLLVLNALYDASQSSAGFE